MASKHLQQHNIWPTGFTLIWAVGFIFTLGILYSRFIALEADYKDYKVENNKKLESLNLQIIELRLANNKELTVIDRSGRVLGTATREAKLSVTPSPSLTPRVITPTMTPIPTHKP